MLPSLLLRLKKGIFDPEYQLSWLFLIVFTIYTWSQSMMFIFEYYLGMQWAIIVSRVLLIYLSLHVVSIFFVKLPRNFVSIAFFYIGLLFLYALLEFVLCNGDQLLKGVLKTSIVTLLTLRIISNQKSLNRLIALNFIFGFIAVLLNTIPLLEFFGVIELHGAPISRVGGELLNPNLDPISYGIFGLTENHVDAGNHAPRLQGWSSEPQNWAYLVFYVLSFGALLTKLIRYKIVIFSLLLIICIHLFFIGSTAAYLSFIGVLVGIFLIVGLDRLGFVKLNHWFFVFVFILIPGLIIPFCLNAIPFFEQFFLHSNLMGEGQNWIQKLSFLDYGLGLYFRSVPVSYDPFHSTHNFILNTYLDFGYVFLMPLIFFFYWFSRCVFFFRSNTLLLASGFWLVSNTLLSSRSFYLPISGVFLMILIGVAIYGHTEEIMGIQPLKNKPL
jgi:hypothetical protein